MGRPGLLGRRLACLLPLEQGWREGVRENPEVRTPGLEASRLALILAPCFHAL